MSTADRDEVLDDLYIARYAERVSDADEVLWRADYARMVDLRERAYDEDAALLGQADAIEARWSSDPEHGPLWTELAEIHSAWIHAPEAMARAHEVYMPGGVQPPGMDQPRWTSHMQAREMTGHGYWPGFEPTHQSSNERHEPMTNTTGHTAAEQQRSHADLVREDEAARGVPASESVEIDQRAADLEQQPMTSTEQLFRHDFTRYVATSESQDPANHDPADDLDRREYMATWADHADLYWFDEWVTVSAIYDAYREDPAEADADYSPLLAGMSPVEARSWAQARTLALNGIERDEHGMVASPYVTRLSDGLAEALRSNQPGLADMRTVTPEVTQQSQPDESRNTPAHPVPSFRASVEARTASLNAFAPEAGESVNAFAAAGAERDGYEW